MSELFYSDLKAIAMKYRDYCTMTGESINGLPILFFMLSSLSRNRHDLIDEMCIKCAEISSNGNSDKCEENANMISEISQDVIEYININKYIIDNPSCKKTRESFIEIRDLLRNEKKT